MKNLSDFAQVLLLTGGAVGFVCWFLAAILIWQLVKLNYVVIRAALVFLAKWIEKVAIRFGGSFAQVLRTVCFLIATALFLNAFRVPIVSAWQYVEQAYLFPVYVNNDTSLWTLQVYEDRLKQKVSEHEFEVVQQATRKTALAIGCSPLAIYEVCYSECGLDPFAANVDRETKDTVAYGWIQFTRAGCKGTTVGGSEISMKQVKSWGSSRPRNIEAMMEATHSYLVGRAKGLPLPTSTEVYTAVFAPGMIGLPEDAVLYSKTGQNPRNYLENSGLDGYGIEAGKIMKGAKYTDGKITKKDMSLHLALKKSLFLNSIK